MDQPKSGPTEPDVSGDTSGVDADQRRSKTRFCSSRSSVKPYITFLSVRLIVNIWNGLKKYFIKHLVAFLSLGPPRVVRGLKFQGG